MKTPALGPTELSLLCEVRLSDEDRGGLSGDELGRDDHDAMRRLLLLGLVEAIGEYGEAPDGEEDERDAGAAECVFRITGAGVLALADHPDFQGRDRS